MNEVFFTSDTHFNHKNILKYNPNRLDHCDDVESMNQAIVDNWNKVVNDSDTVYHLGDVAFGKPENASKWVAQLNGNIHLIKGNHDYTSYLKEIGVFFESVQDYKMLRNLHNKKVVLFHYPIVNWDTKFHGSLHFYGHVHGAPVRELANTRSFDVGIDTHPEMRPYNWYELKDKLKDISPPKLDHHNTTR